MKIKFRAVLPIYKKVNYKLFCKSFDSLVHQKLKPDELIIIFDGPVKGNIKNYIYEKTKNNLHVKIVFFPINKGLGHVLKTATKLSKYDYIARCDADDISDLKRFKTQINFLKKNSKIDVLGSNIYEIEKNKIVSKKKVEKFNEKITKNIFFRNPINHSSVIFKKNYFKIWKL